MVARAQLFTVGAMGRPLWGDPSQYVPNEGFDRVVQSEPIVEAMKAWSLVTVAQARAVEGGFSSRRSMEGGSWGSENRIERSEEKAGQ